MAHGEREIYSDMSWSYSLMTSEVKCQMRGMECHQALVTDNDRKRLTIQLPIDRIAGCLMMSVAPCLTSDDSFLQVQYTMTR